MNNVITFLGSDIPLLVLRPDELQPVISIAIRVLPDKFPPFDDIVRTHRLIPRLPGDDGIGKMNIRVDEL